VFRPIQAIRRNLAVPDLHLGWPAAIVKKQTAAAAFEVLGSPTPVSLRTTAMPLYRPALRESASSMHRLSKLWPEFGPTRSAWRTPWASHTSANWGRRTNLRAQVGKRYRRNMGIVRGQKHARDSRPSVPSRLRPVRSGLHLNAPNVTQNKHVGDNSKKRERGDEGQGPHE
jgi:hypothetical protein